ncbi:MAG: hypothetical protein KC442_08040, partial [Thermomicrobiales bacterium]|nr:hypothetical protein [Thermomicrobiales bacterium]
MLMGWVVAVLVLGARLAALSVEPALAFLGRNPASEQGSGPAALVAQTALPTAPERIAIAAAIVVASVVLATLITRVFAPPAMLAVMGIVGATIFLLAATAAGEVAAVVTTGALLAVAWCAGDLLLGLFRLPLATVPRSAVAGIKAAAGLGAIGTVTVGLGAFDAIAPAPLLSCALVTVLANALRRNSHRRTASREDCTASGSPPRWSWFETVIAGLAGGLFTFAALAALTPETIFNASDAVRQHLPLAREIWQNQAILVYPTIELPSASSLGPAINAVAFGFGGYTSISVLQVSVSVLCM